MSTNQDVQTLEDTLNKTDLGHIINENKKPIIIAAIVIVVAIVAYSLSTYMNNQKRLVQLDRAYDVEETVFNSFLQDKTKAEVFLKALSGLDNKLVGHANLVPALIESVNKLDEKGLVDAKLIATVEKWLKHIKKSNFLYLFLSVRLAGMYEDAKDYDKAIAILEGLVANKSNILKDKIHFDLGRLYLSKGDKKTATERFNVLLSEEGKDITKAPSEYAQLAKMYLSEL